MTAVISAVAGYLVHFFKDSLTKLSKRLGRAMSLTYARIGLYPLLLGRYKQSLVRMYSRIRLGYKDFEIDVTKQYIKLKVNPGFVPPAQRSPDDAAGRTLSIEEILRDQDPAISRTPLRLVVLGQPGSGKTTLLQHLALAYASDERLMPTRKLIPIFIPLRDAFMLFRAESHMNLLDFILSSLEMHKFPGASKFVVPKLQKGECIILLDGLDELLGRDQAEVANEIKRFSIVYDRNIFIVTSRIEGYVRASEILFKEVEVAPLDPAGSEVRSFVSGIIGPDNRPEAFLETLRSDQNLRRLAESPLLLSLIVFVYTESGGNLPKNRTKIYKTAIQWMLRDRDKSKGIYEYRNKFDAEDKDLFLRKLAWAMFVEGSKELDESALVRKIAELSQQLHLDAGNERAFLKEIAESNGILRRVFGERYGFVHPTFQEFYVAKEINEGNRLSDVFAHISDPAWFEVILFLSGLLDFQVAGRFIDRLIEDRRDYVFAGRCLAHASTQIPGASERIVPALIRARSVAAQRALVEIGDAVVVSGLVDLLINTSSVEERVFAEEVLSKLSQKAICEAVENKVRRLKPDENVKQAFRAFQMLDQLRRLAGSGLDDSIASINGALFAAQRKAVAQYNYYTRAHSVDHANEVLRTYEHHSGLSGYLDALLRGNPRLQECWQTLVDLTNNELFDDKEEKKLLGELRFGCEKLQDLCKEARVNVEPFRRKLSLMCDIRIASTHSHAKWVARRNVVCP